MFFKTLFEGAKRLITNAQIGKQAQAQGWPNNQASQSQVQTQNQNMMFAAFGGLVLLLVVLLKK